MFDLEHEITKWRMSLEVGLMSTETIDELESHLREEFVSQLKAGCASSDAFENAVHRLGDISELRAEFGKEGNALPPGQIRFFERLTVGFVHSTEVKVLACTGIVFGLLGFFLFIYGCFRWWTFRRAYGIDSYLLVRVCATYLAMSLTCLLGIVASWRYWRLRRIVEARSVISFNLFIAFFLAWGAIIFLNNVILKTQPLFRYDSPSILIYYSGVLFVVFVIWWLWMRRLARIAYADPVER